MDLLRGAARVAQLQRMLVTRVRAVIAEPASGSHRCRADLEGFVLDNG